MSPLLGSTESLYQASLTVGGSGSGKSLNEVIDALQVAKERRAALIVKDKHGSLTKLIAQHLIKEGLTNRMLYDRFAKFSRILAAQFMQPSTNPDPFERESENHLRVIGFLHVLWRASQRDEKENFFTMPMLSMYLELAARIILFQPKPEPLWKFPFLFRLGHKHCKDLVVSTTDEEAKEEWQKLIDLHKRNADTLLESKIGAARRVTRTVFALPAFRERCDGHLDIRKALQEKKIILLDGSDSANEVVTAIFGLWNLGIFSAQQQHFSETGKPLECVSVWEEAAAVNEVGPTEENILREGRKFGFYPHILTQDLNFRNPRTASIVLGNTRVHKWFNPGDPDLALIAGQDIALAQLDPMKVLDEEEIERVILDLAAMQIPEKKERIQSSKGSDGKERKIKITEMVKEAKYKTVFDKKVTRMSLEDQLKIPASQMLSMKPGEYMIRVRGEYVSSEPEYLPMLPDPYDRKKWMNLGEVLLQKAIAKSQEQPEFKTPVVSESQWVSTTTSQRKSGMLPSSSTSPSVPPPSNNS